MIDGKKNVINWELSELEELFTSWQEPAYRACQVMSWLYQKRVTSWQEMTDLPLSLREKLGRSLNIEKSTVIGKQLSTLDGTTRYQLQLADGNLIECVYLPQKRWDTACLSTQVGCPLKCLFCATGKSGFIRNLTAGEIVEQIMVMERDNQIRIDNVVLMGMGEPLLNFEQTVKAIRLMNSRQGLNIGMRHITLSTVGIVPRIRELAKFKWQINLAISLHAATNELRNKLVPINLRYPLEELFKAAREYLKQTGRRISFEYVMIRGLNDSAEQAQKLARWLKNSRPCHVNLLPFNYVEGTDFVPSTPETIEKFGEILLRASIPTTIRKERGHDISAACGQLRLRVLGSKEKVNGS